MTHTEGPWIAGGSETSRKVWVNDSTGKRIADIKEGEFDWGNARLAASAPALLKSLQDLLDVFEKISGEWNDSQFLPMMEKWQAGKQAIAKAIE